MGDKQVLIAYAARLSSRQQRNRVKKSEWFVLIAYAARLSSRQVSNVNFFTMTDQERVLIAYAARLSSRPIVVFFSHVVMSSRQCLNRLCGSSVQ